MSTSFDEFAVRLQRHSKSNNRYKSLIAHSPDLGHLIGLLRRLEVLEPELQRIDGLKLLFDTRSNSILDPVAAKYWLQKYANNKHLLCLFRFDWVLGKWDQAQREQWWDIVARLETTATLLVGTSFNNPSDQWQQVGELSEQIQPFRFKILKPALSRFNLIG